MIIPVDTDVQISPMYPYVFVTVDTSATITIRDTPSGKGEVVAVYPGCDWVLVGDTVGYVGNGVAFSVGEDTFYAVPYTSIFINYKASLA